MTIDNKCYLSLRLDKLTQIFVIFDLMIAI